jgi:ABC-type branched-subunit amino acid transport system ATPase component
MSIQRLRLTEFSVFEKAEFEFCPGINVIIGANSTGKSHLMKLLYAGHRVAEGAVAARPPLTDEVFNHQLAEKLAGVFKPEEGAIGRLRHRRLGRGSAGVAIETNEGTLSFWLSSLGNLTVQERSWAPATPAVFLPSREVLAMYEGFVAAYEARELSFDETYYDTCKALAASQLRGPRGTRAAELLGPILAALGGGVRLMGNRFYVIQENGTFEAHLVAEGLRKIASVAHLIANGSLVENGLLLWDEPEANLNPRLISQVVEFLQAFARRGVQVFLASHDYLLTQKLSLVAEHPSQQDAVAMKFFSLFREGNAVQVESAPTLAGLERNPILQEFARHYDAEANAFAQSAEVMTPEEPTE